MGATRAPGKPRANLRPPPRRSQEERSAETRGKLIKAAIQVLGESGFANLTISKATQRAGLTNGAMQHHFPSRDDLMLALMDAVYPVQQIPFKDIGAQNLGVRERISKVVDLLWGIYGRPEYLVVWDIALGSRGDRKLWTRVRSYQKAISARMREEFVALFADLDMTPDHVEHTFSLTISYMRGVALQSMFGADRLRQADLAMIKDVAYDLLMKGATPRQTAAER
ncbi:MAG TPA: TetR/AcrR family transcriptional regulator [Caulobacteraceae bacterium]